MIFLFYTALAFSAIKEISDWKTPTVIEIFSIYISQYLSNHEKRDKILAMNNFAFSFTQTTPKEINRAIAKRVRDVRKRRKLSQERLSEVSGVSLGSLKRFEQSGEISLLSLTKIAIALRLEGEMKNLFADVPFLSIEEVGDGKDGKAARLL